MVELQAHVLSQVNLLNMITATQLKQKCLSSVLTVRSMLKHVLHVCYLSSHRDGQT